MTCVPSHCPVISTMFLRFQLCSRYTVQDATPICVNAVMVRDARTCFDAFKMLPGPILESEDAWCSDAWYFTPRAKPKEVPDGGSSEYDPSRVRNRRSLLSGFPTDTSEKGEEGGQEDNEMDDDDYDDVEVDLELSDYGGPQSALKKRGSGTVPVVGINGALNTKGLGFLAFLMVVPLLMTAA